MRELSLTPQARTVLRHLEKAGRITSREALLDHSVQSLTARIAELRRLGFMVSRKFRQHPVSGQRYAVYRLATV